MVHNCLLMVVHTASWLDRMFLICNPLHLCVWARGVLQATRVEFRQKIWAACVPLWMKFEGWLSLINSQLLNDVEWWPIFKPPESSVAKLSSFLAADDRDSVYGLRIKKSCYRPSLLRVWDSATPLTTYACGFLKLPKLVSEISRQHVYHCDGDIQNMWENPETPRFTAMTADMLKMHMHENALNDAHGSVKSKQLYSYPKRLCIIGSWSNVLCPISQRRHSHLVESGDDVS